MTEIFNLFYFKARNPYPEDDAYHYAATGTINFIGSYASESAVEAGIKEDLKEFGESVVSIGSHDDLGDRTVFEDGEPVGYYHVVRCALGEHKNYELHDADSF